MAKIAGITAVVIAVAAVASADVPRGRRAPEVVPTRLVVVEAKLEVGTAAFTVRPGTAVAVGKKRKQQVRVELAGDVRASGWIDRAALGARVAAETEIDDGRVYEGALVRVVERGKTNAKVESVGAVRKAFQMPSASLTVEPVEFVYRMPPNRHFVTPYKDTTLWRKAESVGTNAPSVAVIQGGVEVVLIDQQGTTAHVRTHGPVEVDGWALNKQFEDDRADAAQPELLKATHEVFTGATLYDAPTGTKVLATLRGGTPVEVNAEKGDRMKVTTVGNVVAAGWVDAAALRVIATSVD